MQHLRKQWPEHIRGWAVALYILIGLLGGFCLWLSEELPWLPVRVLLVVFAFILLLLAALYFVNYTGLRFGASYRTQGLVSDIVLGFVGLGLFVKLRTTLSSALFLALGSYGLSMFALKVLNPLLRTTSRHNILLSTSIVLTVTSIYILQKAASPIMAGLGWILLLTAVGRWGKTLIVLFADLRMPMRIRKIYRNNQGLPPYPPVVYVIGYGKVLANPTVTKFQDKIAEALHYRSQRESGSSTLQEAVTEIAPGSIHQALRALLRDRFPKIIGLIHGQHGACFVSCDHFLPSNSTLHLWLLEQAAAVIICRSTFFEDMDEILSQEEFVLSDQATRYYKETTSYIRHMESDVCDRVLGPIYSINVTGFSELANAKTSDSAMLCEIMLLGDSTHEFETATTIAERMITTNFSVKRSDDSLSSKLRSMPGLICRVGVPPLSLCYMRFRCSKSDVERLLGLLDCMELLIKLSVIALLAKCWDMGVPDSAQWGAFLRRPSLGHWIAALRKLSVDTVTVGGNTEEIQQFWQLPLRKAPKQLIESVNGSGLAWLGEIPRSHLGWLDWLSWLRNATKGHGVVDDKLASPLWHGFHETFLDMVSGLQTFIFHSTLLMEGNGRALEELRGCSGYRMNKYFGIEKSFPERNPRSVFLQVSAGTKEGEDRLVSLFPLMVSFQGTIWVWNSTKGSTIEYIDYATGKLERMHFAGDDPYALWNGSK